MGRIELAILIWCSFAITFGGGAVYELSLRHQAIVCQEGC